MQHLSLTPAVEGGSLLIGLSLGGVRAKIEKIAPSGASVLVTGETGTGKELVAYELHAKSRRCGGTFVDLNCAAIPAELLEAELFGHEKGAYTGANGPRKGLVELADGGTLFLDEIGDMPAVLQAKLLRFLDTREWWKLGAARKYSADVRVVAATNKPVAELLAGKEFRTDLYYRLATVTIDLPPLRERPVDIPELAKHFLSRSGASISPETVDVLRRYHWPGNVRELKSALERALIFCEGGEIGVEHFPPAVAAAAGVEVTADELPALFNRLRGRYTKRQVVDAYIAWVVAVCGNNLAAATRWLKIERKILYNRGFRGRGRGGRRQKE